MLHKKIVEPALNQLDADRVTYFGDIINRLESDSRTDQYANMIYLVLKETMKDLPILLDKDEFIDHLFSFVGAHYDRLGRLMYDPRFIQDPHLIGGVTKVFVIQIIDLVLKSMPEEATEGLKLSKHKLTWPYRDTDLLDPEEDEEGWVQAVERAEKWRLEHGGKDRRKSGADRIDQIEAKIK